MCKKFYERNPLFWLNNKSNLNKRFDGPQISQIEIFSDQEGYHMNGRIKGTSDHLATCYNPKILNPALGSKKSINWCLTSKSYREILEEKHFQSPKDIGIRPGLSNIHFNCINHTTLRLLCYIYL